MLSKVYMLPRFQLYGAQYLYSGFREEDGSAYFQHAIFIEWKNDTSRSVGSDMLVGEVVKKINGQRVKNKICGFLSKMCVFVKMQCNGCCWMVPKVL